MHVTFSNIKRGKGMFKFDNNLLKDPLFFELANRDITKHFIFNADLSSYPQALFPVIKTLLTPVTFHMT